MAKTPEKKEDGPLLISIEEPLPEFSIYQHPEADESFLKEHSKVQEVIECLEGIQSANKMDSSKERKKSIVDRKSIVENLDFLVTQRMPTMSRSSFRRMKARRVVLNTNQFTFMRQIEPEPEDRILARQEREFVAETFRRLGNFEYRKLRFDVAIENYTKGLQYVKDTPVLYVNRAMCYIKLREYKRSLMDTDFVLTNLDGKYLRAWLYRAAAYKRLNDEANYEYSVYQARRLNYTETEFIDDFLDKMRSLL